MLKCQAYTVVPGCCGKPVVGVFSISLHLSLFFSFFKEITLMYCVKQKGGKKNDVPVKLG